MRRIVASLIAAGLLVGGAVVVATWSGGSAAAQEDDTPAGRESPWRPGRLLDQVLSELVAEGTITQAQADAITVAMAAEVKVLIGDGPLRSHPLLRAFRLGTLLDDGVITAEELAALPAWHPLRDPDGPAAEYLADGEITAEEFRSLLQQARSPEGD